MTLPLLLTLEQASAQDRALLTDLLHGTAMERATAFQQAKSTIEQSGGFAAARTQAEALVKEAIAALEVFSQSPEREVLTALASYVLNREG